MTELPPPRKRFQIHLSTAIVMMFVAGALMWANFRVSSVETFELTSGSFDSWPHYGVNGINTDKEPKLIITTETMTEQSFGFPFTYRKFRAIPNPSPPPKPENSEYTVTRDDSLKQQPIDTVSLLLNIGITVLAIVGIWFLCEWLIRRRAARKRG